MDYRRLLEHSYEVETAMTECAMGSRLEFLAQQVFEFTASDPVINQMMARKAVEVCSAITDGTANDYIKTQAGNLWFTLMCNLPFFSKRIEWGMSVYSAWWAERPAGHIEFQGPEHWLGEWRLAGENVFTPQEWVDFIRAVIAFAAPEMTAETVVEGPDFGG